MKKIIIAFFCCTCFKLSETQNLFVADTFTYTINLDLSQNLYLKSVPVDLLKGFCKGDWNAYYPKKEMNQCLFDDFLQRFNYYQVSVNSGEISCSENYCNHPYFMEMYNQFKRKLKYKEIVYFDQQHSIVKREVLWIQVYYSRFESDGWKHYDGPVFWLMEIKQSENEVLVYNKNISVNGYTLEKEFDKPNFIVNENKQKDTRKKITKNLQTEEY